MPLFASKKDAILVPLFLLGVVLLFLAIGQIGKECSSGCVDEFGTGYCDQENRYYPTGP